MEAVHRWASGICLGAATAGLCYFIVPKSGLGRVFQILLSLFFLCTVLSPLKTFDLKLSGKWLHQVQEQAEQISQQIQMQSCQAACEMIKSEVQEEIENFLSKKGISPVQIGIDIVQQDGSDKVMLTLCLDSQDQDQEAWLRGCLESEQLELRIQYQERSVLS